jgi:hypothetical protein
MEVVEETRIKDNKKYNALCTKTIRELVEILNSEDYKGVYVVQVLKENGQFITLYYK